jgi:hypothetical protein
MRSFNRWLALSFFIPALSIVPSADARSLDSILQKEIPGSRLATNQDFASALEEKYRGRIVLEADFSGDGVNDWAAIVVIPSSRKYGVYYVINSKIRPKVVNLVSRSYGKEEDVGFIKTPVFFKPIGELGIAERSYNSLTNDGVSRRTRSASWLTPVTTSTLSSLMTFAIVFATPRL